MHPHVFATTGESYSSVIMFMGHRTSFRYIHDRSWCLFPRVYLSPAAPHDNLIDKVGFYNLIQTQTFTCGCVLQRDANGLDLAPCDRHRKEYHESYGLKDV